MPSADPAGVPTIAPSAAPDTVPLLLGLFSPSDLAIILLTAVLVGVNIYYAVQVRQTIAEMRRARGVAVLPRLAISIKSLGTGNGWPVIMNVGPGPAMDVHARIFYLPGGPQITWSQHVVAPGEVREFFPPNPAAPNQRIYRLDALTAIYSEIRLVATFRDALGELHESDDRIEIRDWWEVIKNAYVRVSKDTPEETVKELAKIAEQLQKIANEVQALRQRDESDPWIWEERVRKLPKDWQDRARRVLRVFRRNI
jgi:hypothetical protein